MARPGVTEQEVFEAINALLEMGAKVTVESIRAELGSGSPNTINRHLRTWRAKPPQAINRDSSIQVKQLKKQCVELEAQVQIAIERTEWLSQEILDRDRKLLGLEKELQENRQIIQEFRIENEHMITLHQAVVVERQQIIDQLVAAQKIQAEQFREDIKAINQMSLSQVREFSMSSQDRWLEEKVKSRELGLEIERLKSVNRELEQKVITEQQFNQPLRKRLAEQEKLIGACLDPKKVAAFGREAKEKRL